MFKFVIMFFMSLVITQILVVMFGSENKEKNGIKVTFTVTAKEGVVGCLSKETFFEAAKKYSDKDFAAVKKMIDEQKCFVFKYGDKLQASKETCTERDADDDLFPFKPDGFMLLQPYLPCFSVR